MGRPKICQTFEFAKNFDSMTKFEKYCNKKQFSFRWPKSEKKPNCKVCKLDGKSYDHPWTYKLGECVNIECNLIDKCPKRIQVAFFSHTGKAQQRAFRTTQSWYES